MVPANNSPDNTRHLNSAPYDPEYEPPEAPARGAPTDGSIGTAAGKDPICVMGRLGHTDPKHGAGRRGPAAAEPRAASEHRP